jgi:hypothetical protein
VLRNGRPRAYLLNREALGYLEQVGLSAEIRETVSALPRGERMDEETTRRLLAGRLPTLGSRQFRSILDAMAVAAYHAEEDVPVVRVLVSDDAGQFRWVTERQALCWVHEGRHYKRMSPYLDHHRKLLETFRERFWGFYDELLGYREKPLAEEYERLQKGFDQLFSTVTGFHALDDRIAKTKAKKKSLLMVLEHPEIPLHNNPAELGARMRVRKRDVSFGPRTAAGVSAWDTFMTLVATAKKLGVNFQNYVHDRMTETYSMMSLADLIDTRARGLALGASWTPP